MKIIRNPKNIECSDVIRCLFDLNTLDINVYKKIKKRGGVKVDTLSKTMNKERSTIYRSLQKLAACGILSKKTQTLSSGGYYHVYQCNDSSKIKQQVESCLDEWYKKMKQAVKELKNL
jgi:predicted transcriptional regulator